jgi:hypothetical protein
MIVGPLRAVVALSLLWNPVGPGVWHREMQMAERGPLSVVRVVVVRLDPALIRFRFDSATRDYGTRGAWTVDRMPADALAAVNTGQFIGGIPWGWLVSDGVESTGPGTGSLAMAFVVDSAGVPALLGPAETTKARGHVHLAFQSFPALLAGDGEIPWELQRAGRGVDLDHRDSRLAIGMLANGSVALALTRFTGLGAVVETFPWGPTVVEMAHFMKSLGCRRAMLLDGGLSSQMAFRGDDGKVLRWPNWRSVPLGLIVTPRTESVSPKEAR